MSSQQNFVETIEHSANQTVGQQLITQKLVDEKGNVIDYNLLQIHQPDANNTFGDKTKPRDQEPSMFHLLTWGYEGDGATDFTSKKKTLQTKIRKSDSKWLTEKQDNYRQFVHDGASTYFNYGNDGIENKGQIIDDDGPQFLSSNQKQYGWVTVSNKDVAGQKQETNEPIQEEQQEIEQVSEQTKPKVQKQQRAQSAKSKAPPKTSAAYKSFQNRSNRIKQLNSTTRWLPDSAFTTFFGKPAFHAYGMGNTNPSVGGTVYGQYMLSHSVNPESGNVVPQYQQCYDSAAKKANRSVRVPQLPRKTQDDIRLTPGQLEEIKARNPTMPKSRDSPIRQIQQPELLAEKYFQSNHSSTVVSEMGEKVMEKVQTKVLKPFIKTGQKKDTKLVDGKKTISETKVEKELKQEFATQTKESEMKNEMKTEKKLDNKTEKKLDNKTENKGDNKTKQDNKTDIKLDKTEMKTSILNFIEQDSDIEDDEQKKVDGYSELLRKVAGDDKCRLYLTQQAIAMGLLPPYCVTHGESGSEPAVLELDPKNYKFLPQCWTQRIRPAGKVTHQSDQVNMLITNGW